MKTDIQIAQSVMIQPIKMIAEKIGLDENDLELYGKNKAKITFSKIDALQQENNGKLILVTSINPTPAGEGKSTVTIGLGDALNRIGKKTVVTLREPSLGPVMGIKGGATGGGFAQVSPMDDINLHFTGDIHAITTANNALAALIDNHIQQGNVLQIDPRRILWKRVIDLNDRVLRNTVIGLGGPAQGVPREDGFDITAASEIMAILCLATNLSELKSRIGKILIGYTFDQKPLFVSDLNVEGALTILLKDALKPNLVQTLEGTPVFIHGGPFANIAHGCNSILATKTALKVADYVVTEAGFGGDLGGEKFMDIKVPHLGKSPDVVVIVATVRALKMHGGVKKEKLTAENISALSAGFSNLVKHIENMQHYGCEVVVAINAFTTDTEQEIASLKRLCQQMNILAEMTDVWGKGGAGGAALAAAVLTKIAQVPQPFRVLYNQESSIREKIEIIVTTIYGGKNVMFTAKAERQLAEFEHCAWKNLPVCMAKTPYSLSDDPSKVGRPEQFTVTIRDLIPKLGAGFIVALTSDVMTMPGLPKKPAALNMDIDKFGNISGLF